MRGPGARRGRRRPGLVAVEDARGKPLGAATWAARARLALRMVSRAAEASPASLVELVDARLAAALARRRALWASTATPTGWPTPRATASRPGGRSLRRRRRLPDDLGGDERRARRDRRAGPRAPGRAHRGRTRRRLGPRLRGAAPLRRRRLGGGDARVVYRLGRKPPRGRPARPTAKTGGFLDQADNHAALAALAPPGARALDAFTYHGGFALALAPRGAAPVRAVDENAEAVARARRPTPAATGSPT